MELARAVRGGDAHAHAQVPIILFTAHPPPEYADLAELDVHYLAKTAEWTTIQATIHAVRRA